MQIDSSELPEALRRWGEDNGLLYGPCLWRKVPDPLVPLPWQDACLYANATLHRIASDDERRWYAAILRPPREPYPLVYWGEVV